MRAQGINVISLGAGEPDFDTPEPVRAAAIEALHNGKTRYINSNGLPELRERIADKYARENAMTFSPDQVLVTCGAKHAMYQVLMVLLDAGDEVLIPAPFWMTYEDQVRLAGGEVIAIPTRSEDGFVPNVHDLSRHISKRTKAIIINSPCNPTGAAYDRAVLEGIAELAMRHNLWVIADEIYERLIYAGAHVSIGSLSPEIHARTVTVSGCSKSFAMTGWRIGYAVGPLSVIRAASCLQDQVTSNATSFAQYGALAALELPDATVDAMRDSFRTRRDAILRMVREIPGVEAQEPHGAFYLFPNMTKLLQECKMTDIELADRLLDDAAVATVPGSVFHGPGHLRLSYATSASEIEEGMNRIKDCVTRLLP